MEDVWIDAVQQCLRGEDWVQAVDAFVDQHCLVFCDAGENLGGDPGTFTHEHHGVFRTYRELVDAQLARVLGNLGGNVDQLVEAMEGMHERQAALGHDDRLRRLQRTLNVYESFGAFSQLMLAQLRNQRLLQEDGGENALLERALALSAQEEERKRRELMQESLWRTQWELQVRASLRCLSLHCRTCSCA